MWLRRQHRQLILALGNGVTLKSHRDVDGRKTYLLHHLDGTTEYVPHRVVQRLMARKLIGCNQKFPAATFLLTAKGQAYAQSLGTVSLGGVSRIVRW